MDYYEMDLKAEFTGILCTMALNMSRHLSTARQNKVLLLPELKKVVRNLICCECDSSIEQIQNSKNQQCKPRSKQSCKKNQCPCPSNKSKLDPCQKEVSSKNSPRKFIPPERISVKIKNLRHVKPQSSTILTKRRLSINNKTFNDTDQSTSSIFVYRHRDCPTSESDR